MTHPKMLHTYVGIDSHKDTHTAVFLDCFFEKLGELSFGNTTPDFEKFLDNAQKFLIDGTSFLFGLEDTSKFGRALAYFLTASGHAVKHVNAYLVAGERKNRNMEKTDSGDAECAARLLITEFGKLPDADNDEKYHMLRTLVVRRDFLTRNNRAIQSYIHSLLTIDFPNYHRFFSALTKKSAIAFFTTYPSPDKLAGVTAEELGEFLRENSNKILDVKRAMLILESVDTTAKPTPTHEIRNKTVLSAFRQLTFNMEETENIERDLTVVYKSFNVTLTSLMGLDTVTASQLLSCIGDIRNFATPAKLARYAGIAPVSHSSGNKDTRFANQRGDRELNSIIYNLAVRLIVTFKPKNKAQNAFFHEYYNKKLSEGKTKRQALKCVQRRLVNILWTMLTRNEDYVNPPYIEFDKART